MIDQKSYRNLIVVKIRPRVLLVKSSMIPNPMIYFDHVTSRLVIDPPMIVFGIHWLRDQFRLVIQYF